VEELKKYSSQDGHLALARLSAMLLIQKLAATGSNKLNYMKKNTLLLIAALVFLIMVMIFAIFSNLSRRPDFQVEPVIISPTFIEPVREVNTIFAQPVFNGERQSLPEALPLLLVQTRNLPNLNDALSQYCQFAYAEEEIYFYGEVCDYTLFDQGQTPQVIFYGIEESDVLITFEQADETVRNFMNNVYQAQTPQLIAEDTVMLSGYDEFHLTDNPSEANAMQLYYSYEHQNIPVVGHHYFDDIFSFTVYGAGKLFHAEIKNRVLFFQPQETLYQLLSIDRALTNIANNNAYLEQIWMEDLGMVTPNLEALKNINLNQVSLDYRINTDKTLAIPSYRFTGTATDRDNTNLDITIITPAINFVVGE
jgi:hypothetical protein